MNLKDLISILVDADKKLENKKEVTEDAKDSLSSSVKEPETKEETEKPVEVDARDTRIKELEELLKQKDAIITQNGEQIQALKELTSTDNPVNTPELTLQQLIEKGEF